MLLSCNLAAIFCNSMSSAARVSSSFSFKNMEYFNMSDSYICLDVLTLLLTQCFSLQRPFNLWARKLYSWGSRLAITTGAVKGSTGHVNDKSTEQRERGLKTKSWFQDVNLILAVVEERRDGAADHEYAVLFCLLVFGTWLWGTAHDVHLHGCIFTTALVPRAKSSPLGTD